MIPHLIEIRQLFNEAKKKVGKKNFEFCNRLLEGGMMSLNPIPIQGSAWTATNKSSSSAPATTTQQIRH